MTNSYKSGRSNRASLNCETPEAQSVSGKRGGLKKLDANQIEALWDKVQAHTRATFYWKAPEAAK
jgi:hypothetical protein